MKWGLTRSRIQLQPQLCVEVAENKLSFDFGNYSNIY